MKSDAGARPRSAHRSYGKLALKVQRLAVAFAFAGLVFVGLVGTASAAERTIKVVALGDSLTAGFRLRGSAAFPVQLEQALKAKGLAVEVANAGVSGDTASGGLARLDWSVPDGTDAVILELGANDMLRGIDPKVTREALEEIVRRLKARRIEVLLCGMRAAPNLGADYGARVRSDLSGAAPRTIWFFIRFSSMALSPIRSSTSATACIRPAQALRGSSPASCRRSRPCSARDPGEAPAHLNGSLRTMPRLFTGLEIPESTGRGAVAACAAACRARAGSIRKIIT